jgi:hypothetical protein
MFQIKAPDELSDTLFIRRNPVFFSMRGCNLFQRPNLVILKIQSTKKHFSFRLGEMLFLYSVSLGVMIFFAAGDPEGNCHEKCQQLGDGNGKPDTVRAEP